MKKVLIIVGPTATGKTKLAARIAKKFGGELISADSRQVYRGMDLTTGKERVDVPTWLYDVVSPDESFSVSHWVALAIQAVSDIHTRRKLPIIVGGTGLYIKALLAPFETINIAPNFDLRKKMERKSVRELQSLVVRGTMNQSDWNNPRRLIRKIEIAHGKKEAITKPNWRVLTIGLTAPLSVLDKGIDDRFQKRMAEGLAEEIAFLRKTYSSDLPAMSAIDLNEHAYARRQLTWFKKQKNIHWFDIADDGWSDEVEKLVAAWYTRS